MCACSTRKRSPDTPNLWDVGVSETMDPELMSEQETEDAETEPEQETAEEYAKIVKDKVQGVWCHEYEDGTLFLYTFRNAYINTYIIGTSRGSLQVLSGTFAVNMEQGKLDYYFGGSTGYATFTYDGDVLALVDAEGDELSQMSASDVMEYLTRKESEGNNEGVVCLANILKVFFPGSDESNAANEKKEAANAAIDAEIVALGEELLQNFNAEYDQVQKVTFYTHKDMPQYINERCYIYPIIARTDVGYTCMFIRLNYTDAQTGRGWIFFNKVIFSVDGENTTRSFNYFDVTRDNNLDVWETVDISVNASELKLLEDIVNSNETIIRFQGDSYYEDHFVSDTEKAAIQDALTTYDYLKSYSN